MEFNVLYLAHNLNKPVEEIAEMPLTMFNKWLEYFSIVNGSSEIDKPEVSDEEIAKKNKDNMPSFVSSALRAVGTNLE